LVHKHIAQEVPNALPRCEFGCRVGQCSRDRGSSAKEGSFWRSS